MEREEAYAIAEYVFGLLDANKHEREWWATYRAALTGLTAADIECVRRADSLHKWAAESADFAHGPLETKP